MLLLTNHFVRSKYIQKEIIRLIKLLSELFFENHVRTVTLSDQQVCSDLGTNPRMTNIYTEFMSHDVRAKVHYLSLGRGEYKVLVQSIHTPFYKINYKD